jgi:hypothetical protein
VETLTADDPLRRPEIDVDVPMVELYLDVDLQAAAV